MTTSTSETLVSSIVSQLGDLLNLYTSSNAELVILQGNISTLTTEHASALASQLGTHQAELQQVVIAAQTDIAAIEDTKTALVANYQAQLDVKDELISSLGNTISTLETQVQELLNPAIDDTPDDQQEVMTKLGIEHA